MSYQLSRGALETAIQADGNDAKLCVQVLEFQRQERHCKLVVTDGVVSGVVLLTNSAASGLTDEQFHFAVLEVGAYTKAPSHGIPILVFLEVRVLAQETINLAPGARKLIQSPSAQQQQSTSSSSSSSSSSTGSMATGQFMQQGGGGGGGGAAGAGAQFMQQAGPTGGAPQQFHPIASLNPYHNRWTIRARVMNKGPMKTFTSRTTGAEGCLFSVDLCDESGEIRATLFTEAARKWDPILQKGGVYVISRGQVKQANKRFSTLNNDYELTLDEGTLIERAQDSAAVPQMKYTLVPIADIARLEKDDVVDVCAVVMETGPVSTMTTKAGKELNKRAVQLVDMSNHSIELTLWAEKADDPGWSEHDHPVVCIKGARIGDYRGRSLSTTNGSVIVVNPSFPEEAQKVGQWYQSQGGNIPNVIPLGGDGAMGGAGGGATFDIPTKTLAEVKDEQFGAAGPMTFQCYARVGLVKHDATGTRQPWYNACVGPDCKKGVSESGGQWYCSKCNQNYDRMEERYVLSMVLNDHTGSMWVSAFNDEGQKLLGVSAPQLAGYLRGNVQAYDAVFDKVVFKLLDLQITAKMEDYNGEQRMKYVIRRINDFDFASASRQRIDTLRAAGLAI